MKDQVKKFYDELAKAGFDDFKLQFNDTNATELNIAHNDVSLLRSTQEQVISVSAILDQRQASASMTSLDSEAFTALISDLKNDVRSAKQDPANAVSSNEVGQFADGPQVADQEAMALTAQQFLNYRKESYPDFVIEEAQIKHVLEKKLTMTSGQSDLESSIGYYDFGFLGATKDEHGSSSFNFVSGQRQSMPDKLAACFDIEELMSNSALETQTELVGEKFIGDVILTPNAVSALVGWLVSQLGDSELIQKKSLYKDDLENLIATPMLTIESYNDGAGYPAFNADAFVSKPLTLLEQGRLKAFVPSYFGARKLDIPYHSLGCMTNWKILPGDTTRADMLSDTEKGAIVGRLSMGNPAANGNFSGVIKNSFLIENGQKTKALSETMISGNVAQMLKDICAISQEVTECGCSSYPWIKVKGLVFS